jgi:hypothetical protein
MNVEWLSNRESLDVRTSYEVYKTKCERLIRDNNYMNVEWLSNRESLDVRTSYEVYKTWSASLRGELDCYNKKSVSALHLKKSGFALHLKIRE